MQENSNIEVSQITACALTRQLCEDLCITVTTSIGFLASVETDMVIQSTTLWELRNTGIIFAGSLCGSNYHYHLLRIVHHRYHICRVLPVWIQTCFLKLPLTENCAPQVSHLYGSPMCGYGHVSSNYHLLRIVHPRYHICMVYAQCGNGNVSSNYYFVRIVHHRNHICMVYAQYGYGHVS